MARIRITLALVFGGLAALAEARPLAAQAEGAVAGEARRAESGAGLPGVQVLVDDRVGAVSDTAGRYRVRAVRSGWHRVAARLIGYRGVVLDSVFVPAGATVTVDFDLDANPTELEPLVVTAPYDAVLDPLATSTEQKISAEDLRDLPISTLEEALALSAGSVGTSYRGGRIGQESFILDGLGVKNQLDAASGGLGLQIPPDLLSEASLVTNGFSARFGQALSGLVNVVTREPGEAWEGRVAYEGDRPFGGGLDRGLDRLALRAGAPCRDDSAWSRRSTSRAGSTPIRSVRRRRRIRAIRGPRCPTLSRTTAASSGPARPSWSCRSRSARPSVHLACIRRTSGCSTIPPTSTIRTTGRRSDFAAIW